MKKRSVIRLQQVWLLTVCLLLHFFAGAQNLEVTLAAYATKYVQERAYLHYDKPVYATGETVWFKAYLMQGILPAESKTVYVDWVNEDGTVLKHHVLPVVNAVASGHFDIPSDYTGAFIHVRAYTSWMLNFDSSFLYNKDLRVVGSTQHPVSKPEFATTSLQFFAEGGDLVAGIKSKVAFLAADPWGRPVPVSGVVQRNDGTTVTKFAAQHDGMGVFYLEPQPGQTYTAKWKDAKGAEHTTELPAAKSSGVALQLELQGTKRRFTVTRTADAPETLKQLYLVGTMGENLVFKTITGLTAQATASGLIPTEALPTGILTVTVFDANWNALAERITFVKNNDYGFTAEMNVAQWGLNKYARNDIEITVPDSIEANLSIAVTDNAIAPDSSDNIITRLLLTSDLKGYVPHPEYYFSSNSDTVAQHLDLVMLTHGWRRFKWEDVVKGKMPAITFPKDTTYLTLSGKIYGTLPGTAGGSSIVLFVKERDSSAKMLMEPLSPDGSFNDPDAIFFDTLRVYYQLQPAKAFRGADVGFMQRRLPPLDYRQAAKRFMGVAPRSDTAGAYRLALLAEASAKADALLKQKTLANVTVRAKTQTPVQQMDQKYASGLFSGSDSYQFDLVNDPAANGYRDIFSYLQGKVPGLQITPGANGPALNWRGGTPAVFLDQMNTDVSLLASLPVSDIAYVKVFRPPFMGAYNGGSGGIAIYTRRGNDVPVTPGKGLNSNTIFGYTPVKEFFSPNYSRTDPRTNEQRDLRTTLYWNPAVLTSSQNHTVKITFYNNDITKAFRVIIEGMTSDGRLVHVEQVME